MLPLGSFPKVQIQHISGVLAPIRNLLIDANTSYTIEKPWCEEKAELRLNNMVVLMSSFFSDEAMATFKSRNRAETLTAMSTRHQAAKIQNDEAAPWMAAQQAVAPATGAALASAGPVVVAAPAAAAATAAAAPAVAATAVPPTEPIVGEVEVVAADVY